MTVSQPSFGSVEKSETAQPHERVYGVYGYDIISFFSLNELIWASPPMQFEREMSRPPAGLWLSSPGSGLCWLVQRVSSPLMDIRFQRNDRKRD